MSGLLLQPPAFRRALILVRQRARYQLSQAKRMRKYREHQQVIPPEELAHLQALVDLERAATVLLGGVPSPPPADPLALVTWSDP